MNGRWHATYWKHRQLALTDFTGCRVMEWTPETLRKGFRLCLIWDEFSARIHFNRIAGGDSYHRNSCRDIDARAVGSQEAWRAGCMHQQPERTCPGHEDVS